MDITESYGQTLRWRRSSRSCSSWKPGVDICLKFILISALGGGEEEQVHVILARISDQNPSIDNANTFLNEASTYVIKCRSI